MDKVIQMARNLIYGTPQAIEDNKNLLVNSLQQKIQSIDLPNKAVNLAKGYISTPDFTSNKKYPQEYMTGQALGNLPPTTAIGGADDLLRGGITLTGIAKGISNSDKMEQALKSLSLTDDVKNTIVKRVIELQQSNRKLLPDEKSFLKKMQSLIANNLKVASMLR